MALVPRLEFRQAQSLTLTPQLMQSIRLLQLSHLEIETFVETELERNPLLERDDSAAPDGEGPGEPSMIAEDAVSSGSDTGTIESAGSIADNLDTDVSNIFPEQVGQDSYTQSARGRAEGGGWAETSSDPDEYVAGVPTVAEQVFEQASGFLRDAQQRLIGRYLIDNLTDAGYLGISTCDAAEQLGVDEAGICRVLEKLQQCEPAGLFARNLAECLAIQLRAQDRLDPIMARLLEHLDLAAAHDIAGLCRIVGADREDVMDMLAELKNLDPRPGRAFDTAPVQAIVPDVYVQRGVGARDFEGQEIKWLVELNTDILPRVLVNRTYYSLVLTRSRDAAEKRFMTDCLQSANWLTKSLDQRAQTILKVATEIVRQQEGFLDQGVSALKPMTLKTVAEAIGAHESTVSRVTANKYLATPRGLFEMKYFFTTAIGASNGGADHSAEAVRHRIRQLIDEERASSILSDDVIAEMLKREQGIELARRTVAKYRESMNIPSSVVRRRQKKSLVAAH